MKLFKATCAFGTAALIAGLSANAAILDDFETDTSANYTVVNNDVTGFDGSVTFNYDYSADGIASAPGSGGGTTSGLRMTINDTAGPFGTDERIGVTAYHNTAVTDAAYRLTVDVWMNVSGSGSTEFGGAGVAGDGAAVNTIFNPVAGEGHFLSFTGDGDSSSDFRHTTPTILAVPSGDATYLNSTNTTEASGDTYQAIFAGGTHPGSPGNRWTTLTITVDAGLITYAFDGTDIIQTTYDNSDGNQVSLSYADLFSSVASPFQAQFVIYDNLSVEAIPEPGSLALLGLGGLALLRRRR